MLISMGFDNALIVLKDGYSVARRSWYENCGKTMWIHLVDIPAYVNGREKKPYLEMKTVDGGWIPWVATQEDLLAEDWVVVARRK